MPDADKKVVSVSSSNRRWVVLLLLPVVAAIAAGIWFWFHRENAAVVEAAPETRVKSTLHLETFVLNLADPDQRSYLRVGIDLGLNRQTKHGEEPPVAQVRDTILGVLAQGKVDDLLTASGKAKLKASLVAALRERMPELGVEEVYFTEFLIQR